MRVLELLANAPQIKRVAVHAQLPPAAAAAADQADDVASAVDALLVLEQIALPTQPEPLQSLLQSLQFSVQFHNDRYWKLTGSIAGTSPLLGVDVRVTCPASAADLDKERERDHFIIRETRDAYARVVGPFIDSVPAARTQWLLNILEGRSEQDRVLHADADFMLLPDFKWDQRSERQLYCQAIVRGGGGVDGAEPLRSLRELRAVHAPLLRRLRRAAFAEITRRYGVSAAHIFAYIHYQPSFYHLHVHFVHLALAGEGGRVSNACHRAHLLDTVIDHLEMGGGSGSEYYANATLTYQLGEGDALLAALRERAPETLTLAEEDN